MIKRLFKRISSITKFSKEMSPIVDSSSITIFADFMLCRIKYGIDEEDYRALEFYKKSAMERRSFTTARKNAFQLSQRYATEQEKEIMNNKYLFNKAFKCFINRQFVSTRDNTLSEIMDFIKFNGEVMVKNETGNSGLGVHKLNYSDTEHLNEFIRTLKGIYDSSTKNHLLIEQIIPQHEGMAYFNSSCVNTCRIETITDKNGKSHIVNTVVISGGLNSHISNTHSGGVMVHINEETGIVDSKGRNPDGETFLHHPGTGVLLLGHKIPFWKDTIELALKLAEVIPRARYIGWDIAITPNGPEVIEGNLVPGHCTQSTDMVGRWPIIKKYL